MSSVAPDRRLRPLWLVLGLVSALGATVLLVSAIGRVAGFTKVRHALDGANFLWLLVCAGGQCVVFTGYAGALRNAVAFEGGPAIPARLALGLAFAGFAATQTLAFGGIGGLAIMYWAMRRLELPRRDAAVRLIGLNTAVYLVFGVIAFVAAAIALLTNAASLPLELAWLGGFPVVLLTARWFTAPARVEAWAVPHGGRMRRALATGIGAAWWVRRATVAREARPLFGWAALYWIGDIASLWAGLHSFGAPVSLTGVAVAYTTGYLAQSLPIPLIATGGVDAATTLVLHSIGVPLEVALVGVVAHRLFAFWLPVMPGGVMAALLPRLGRSLAAIAESPEATASLGELSPG